MWYGMKRKLGLISESRYLNQYHKWNFAKDLREIVHGRINVLANSHTSFIAEAIVETLRDYGFESDAVYEFNKKSDQKAFYIVIAANAFLKRLPKRYIAFNVEQSISARWFTPEYLGALNKAYGVLDYSQLNISYLKQKQIRPGFLFYAKLTPRVMPVLSFEEKTTPILFYGDNSCPRRKAMLERISRKYPVKIINNLFHDDMLAELDKARIIVNIHFYEGAMLETTRLCEALSHGCMVVSETSVNDAEYPELQEMVDFTPVDDAAALEARIDYWMSHEDELRRKMEENRRKVAECAGLFRMFIARMLLCYKLIDFESFYEHEKNSYTIGDGRICLSLPETPERGEWFRKQNKYGFKFFPGLRHAVGWIGCAMSYKFLARKALDEGCSLLTICEDDAELPANFAEQYAELLEYVSRSDVDVYSGFLVDLKEDASILSVEPLSENRRMVVTDSFISMVFGVYKEKIQRLIADWNPADDNPDTNTIDRYLERESGLKVAFTWPFLVNHCEDLFSTMWNFKNDFYNTHLQKSLEHITAKIDVFQSKNG